MPPPYAGVPKLILATARLWREAGHDIGITFTYQPKNPDDLGAKATYFFEYEKRPGKVAKALFLARYFLTNPTLYVSLLKAYRAICPHVSRENYLYAAYGVYLDGVYARFKPDIILGEAVLVKSFMAAEIANRRGIPIVFDVYAEVRDLSMGENRHLNEDERKRYWVGFLNKASLVLGMDNCSVEMRAYLPEGKLKEFWDTGDYEFYSQPVSETREELRKHFNLPEKTFLVSAVGSFELRKGHDHLLVAVAQLAKEGYDVGVVICGSQGGNAKWKKIAEEEGIADRAFFFSSISEHELVKLHHATDLYTNLSNTQRCCGFDLALAEAMATGLPVVVYDNGALKKVVPEGKNGYVVPMNDLPAVREAILKVYHASLEERKEMGRRSAEFAATIDLRKTTAIKLGWFTDLVEGRLHA